MRVAKAGTQAQRGWSSRALLQVLAPAPARTRFLAVVILRPAASESDGGRGTC